MGSTSIIPAALMRVCILSACVQFIPVSNRFRGTSNFFFSCRAALRRGVVDALTVISTPSSARINAA